MCAKIAQGCAQLAIVSNHRPFSNQSAIIVVEPVTKVFAVHERSLNADAASVVVGGDASSRYPAACRAWRQCSRPSFLPGTRDEHGSPVQPGARARTVPGRRAALALASGDGADAMHARKSKLHKSAPSVSEVVRLIGGGPLGRRGYAGVEMNAKDNGRAPGYGPAGPRRSPWRPAATRHDQPTRMMTPSRRRWSTVPTGSARAGPRIDCAGTRRAAGTPRHRPGITAENRARYSWPASAGRARAGIGNLADDRFGRQQQAGDRRGVLQR